MSGPVYTWSPTTPLGLLNEELRHLWVGIDEADRNRIDVEAMDHRGAYSFTALGGMPALKFRDGVSDFGGATMKRPEHWIDGGAISLVDYWSANNTTGGLYVTLQNVLKHWLVGTTSGAFMVATHQDILVPTTAFALFSVTHTVSSISGLTDSPFIGMKPMRLGADAADTYTGEIYYLGSILTYTPA